MHKSLLSFAVLSAITLAACQPDAAPTPPVETPSTPAADAATAPAPAATPEPAAPVETSAPDPRSVLAGKVWRVTQRSDGSPAGATYAFLEDGRLVISDAGSTPMTGSWAVQYGKLSTTEEGVTYPTIMTVTDADHVSLRSYNPAGVLALELERARDVPLPN